MTDIKALFCPKCKGEVTDRGVTSTGYPMGNAILWCSNCENTYLNKKGRYYFEMDCLTEEQLKDPSFQWMEQIKEMCGSLKDVPINQELIDRLKQPPSFCFAEGEVVIQVALREAKSQIGKIVDGLESDIASNDWQKEMEQSYKKAHGVPDHVELQKDDEWINFSDRKPEVGQDIVIYHDIFTHCFYNRESQYMGMRDFNNSALILWGGVTYQIVPDFKWKPAQESKQEEKECEHDLELAKGPSCDLRKAVKTEREKQIAMIALQQGADNYRKDLRKGLIKDPREDVKSQSQIAIEKVINALEEGINWMKENEFGVPYNLIITIEKLKELNK